MSDIQGEDSSPIPGPIRRYILRAELNNRLAKELFDHLNSPPTLLWAKNLNKLAELLDPGYVIHIAKLETLIATNLNARTLPIFIDLVLKNQQKARQSSNAIKRHAENHAMKADVFSWLDANMATCKSMDAAAEKIAGKIAPIAFRTARRWVGEWKKLRSAGTT